MLLYVLCEGERDGFLLERLAERATVRTFQTPRDEPHLRQNASWKQVMAGARIQLNRFKNMGGVRQDIGIIIAVDNDRAPGHPGATLPPPRPLPNRDRAKSSRYEALQTMVRDALGPRREDWPVEVALAVPVEMIESWVLHLHDPSRPEPLPLFAEADQPGARAYHGGQAPPQLKDLCRAEALAAGHSLADHFWAAAECDLDAASEASPSLAMYLAELRTWHPSVP